MNLKITVKKAVPHSAWAWLMLDNSGRCCRLEATQRNTGFLRTSYNNHTLSQSSFESFTDFLFLLKWATCAQCDVSASRSEERQLLTAALSAATCHSPRESSETRQNVAKYLELLFFTRSKGKSNITWQQHLAQKCFALSRLKWACNLSEKRLHPSPASFKFSLCWPSGSKREVLPFFS